MKLEAEFSVIVTNVQGINRLGKGPAKPGTMRPADPNKYKTSDFFSEGTEGDKDYQRMVQDVRLLYQSYIYLYY